MITEQQRLAGSAIQKCRSGQPISDVELKAGITVLNQIIPALLAMGETYRLVYADLNRKHDLLEGFKRARKI